MSLFKKLLLPSALAIFLMLILGVASYLALGAVGRQIDEISTANVNVEAANALKADVLEAHSGAYRLITWANATDGSRLEDGTKVLLGKLDQAGTKITQWSQSAALTPQMREQGSKIVERLGKYRKSVAQALDMASMDANTGVSAMQTADDDFKALEQVVTELVTASHQASETIRADTARTNKTMSVLVVSLLVAALVFTGSINYLLAKGIAGNIKRATDVAERVASGDLTSSIDRGSNDEIGRLLDTLGAMQASLRDVIGAVGRSADTMHLTAGDMATAAEGINRAVEEQSGSIASTAATVEEMTVSIGHVSDSAEATRVVAAETAEVAKTGHRVAGEAATEVQKIFDKVTVAANTMKALAESSEKIGSVANVIRGIADQTNLLALNAAIEAARAGEQGRGFAVVADEVRKLAESTSSATNEIKVMIEAIQSQSSGAVREMEMASAEVISGVRLIHGLQAPLDHLRQGAASSLASLVELSLATREQSEASGVIARNIEVIARKGDDNSEAAIRSLELANELHRMADALRASLTRFRY